MTTFLGGDMNFPPLGDATTHIRRRGSVHRHERRPAHRQWAVVFQCVSPLAPQDHTRFATSDAYDDPTATGSAIDYISTNAPSAMLAHMAITITPHAHTTASARPSDHVPVTVSVRLIATAAMLVKATPV